MEIKGSRPASDFNVGENLGAGEVPKISKIQNQNLHFWIFSKTSFRNELHTPFLPYFDTQHSICKILTFLLLVVWGSQGVPKILTYFLWYLKIISTRFLKRFFWLKQKINKYLCTGCPKSAVSGKKQICLNKYSPYRVKLIRRNASKMDVSLYILFFTGRGEGTTDASPKLKQFLDPPPPGSATCSWRLYDNGIVMLCHSVFSDPCCRQHKYCVPWLI